MKRPVVASMSDAVPVVVVVVLRSEKMKSVVEKGVDCGGRGYGGLRLW